MQYERGALQALADDTRGRKSTRNPLDDEVQCLRKQNTRLERRLKQAEAIIQIQKKSRRSWASPWPRSTKTKGSADGYRAGNADAKFYRTFFSQMDKGIFLQQEGV